ncbi:MAG: hypothetical protein KKH33_22695 [Alphaproteobacteria bacterium]|jgi:hypothetical protein|nr:hypothetical protein [Alphaproteobacteria bacterium]
MSNPHQPSEDPDPITRFVTSPDVNLRYLVGSKDRIRAYEAKYGLEFSESYVQFLSRENGLQHTLDLETAAERMPDEKLTAGWLAYVNVFFGIGNENPDLDLEILAPTMTFHDYEVTPFAHPIAIGEDATTMVEIQRGAHRGWIMLVQHDRVSNLRRRIARSRSVDEIVQQLMGLRYYTKLANDFEELIMKYAQLVAPTVSR